jgi:tetratricopeptide (TPR) repeat protein
MPSNARAAAADANRRGVSLHRQGRVEEAVDAFREGIASQGGVAELHTNLGAALMQLGRFDDARAEYERVLEIQPDDLLAHSAMYELEQIRGNPAKAVTHQARVLAQQTVFSQIAPREARSVLALMAPGDWQANVPIDFLIDRETTTVHKFYILSQAQAAAAVLPAAGVVFTAIAESDENEERLRVAEDVVAHLQLPVINRPERVLGTSRTRVWQALHDLPNVVVPQTLRRGKAELERGETGIEYPLVIRPVGSHAGHGLERVNDARDLAGYLSRSSGAQYYIMPFVDFSKGDGFFRKYRIIVVDGVPYAYHLAISPRWMIHYYNAPMQEHAWMRDEERRFLDDFPSVFDPALVRAIGEMASRLGLEYFGIDCSIDRKGRLVLFEADPAMIVHAGDDPQLFGYKIPAAQRVFAAFERLIDRVGSR